MTRAVLHEVETPADEPGRASSLLASLHATSDWGWRTAGLFFALPGASVLVKLDVPVMSRVFAGVVCAVGIVLVAWPHWPIAVRRFGPLIPILATANLWWLNVSSHGVAFPDWEIVLWYAAGFVWIGLTQTTRALWLSPLFVGSFLLTSPAVFDAASVFTACLSVGVMSAVAHTVSSELRRGRGAYAKMRQGVHHMTAVVTSEKACPRKSPSEIYRATGATALELGFSGAGIAHVNTAQKQWEWRSWSGEEIPESFSPQLPELILTTAEDEDLRLVEYHGRQAILAPLLRAEEVAYVLVADAPHEVEQEQLSALELLAAQMARGLEIRRMAFYDTLTQLPNRSLFQDRLAENVGRAASDENYSFALLYLDVDRFKAINDLYGHNVGDGFLVELAARLRSCLRKIDYISHKGDASSSRLGGDEFAVLLPGVANADDATRVAERIHTLLSQPVVVEDRKVNTCPSIGVVLSSARYTEPSVMMRDADRAMYHAKRAGHLQCAVFDSEMRGSVDRGVELERSLGGALRRKELSLRYQPISLSDDQRPVGLEALMRWRHPTLGDISPSEFIPIAEDTGSIRELTQFAIDQVIEQLPRWNALWRHAEPLYVTINLSRKQVGDPGLLEHTRAALAAGQVAPEQLVFEITEGMVRVDPELTRTFLAELRAIGLRLALDDFGTAYSSLSCLHELPVEMLKLDRDFVVAARTDERARGAVRGLVQMAQMMGLQVVAEGVEKADQLELVRQTGCDLVQGDLISPPLQAEAATTWLEGHANVRPTLADPSPSTSNALLRTREAC